MSIEAREEYDRIRFMKGPREAGYRFPREKQFVISVDATAQEVAEMIASGLLDDVTSLTLGPSKPPTDAALVEQPLDLSRLVHVRDACVWYAPVPEGLFTLPALASLEIASLTPRFSRIGRPYPSLRTLRIRGFNARKTLMALPIDFAHFSGLEVFEANTIGLKELPEAMADLPLRVVKVHDAKTLKKLPSRFGATLEVLELTGVAAKTLPDTSAAPKAKVEIG